MPTIDFNMPGLQVSEAFVDDLRSLLLPLAEQFVGSPGRPATHDAPDYLGWGEWNLTAVDGVQYSNRSLGDPPMPAHLEGATSANLRLFAGVNAPYAPTYGITVFTHTGYAGVSVLAPDEDVRQLAQAVREKFARHVVEQTGALPRSFKVFIAFGGGPAWEVVRDYLRRADIEVDAFTETERVGEVTIDVVSQMVHSASVAVIVMTAADEMRDGSWHARQNVIHEAGFAQAAIGVRNTIILLEEGVTLPSNLANVTYIPFPRGAVHTTERRVVARVLETKADMESNGGYPIGGGGC